MSEDVRSSKVRESKYTECGDSDNSARDCFLLGILRVQRLEKSAIGRVKGIMTAIFGEEGDGDESCN